MKREKTAAGGYQIPDAEYTQRWVQRVLSRITVTAKGCMEWNGFCHGFRNQKPGQRGYPETNWRGKNVRITRKLLEITLGRPLTAEEQACHHCDNPPCINPGHLYAATNQQNHIDGGKRKRMQGQLKTHCDSGHEFTPENTYWSRRYTVNGVVGLCRNCKECQRINQRRRYHERKQQASV